MNRILSASTSVAALFLSSTIAHADAKETCSDIVNHLGYSDADYLFEERGIFTMEQHHFGTLTCYINFDGEFDSLYQGETPIAEDGYFGIEALAERERLVAEFEADVTAAREIRQSQIEAAREEFRQTEAALTTERDAALEAVRIASDPLTVATETPEVALSPEAQEETSVFGSEDQGSDEQTLQMYVAVDRLTRRTCPSTNCGSVGMLLYRQAVEVFEEQDGWARISPFYDASCVDGRSEYVDNGRADCIAENGIADGMLAEWASIEFLDAQQPSDPAETATVEEELVSQSDDFQTYRAQFLEAASTLVEQGRCSENDFIEMGGWVSSPSQGDGVYFIYCGGLRVENRLYLNVATGEIYQ